MVLNKKKCEFEKSDIIFLGHKITSSGIYPDERKIEAILKMSYPNNVNNLQRFLDTINYLAKFIPNLSDRTVTLRKLLEKNTLWVFEEAHKKEVDALKLGRRTLRPR